MWLDLPIPRHIIIALATSLLPLTVGAHAHEGLSVRVSLVLHVTS